MASTGDGDPSSVVSSDSGSGLLPPRDNGHEVDSQTRKLQQLLHEPPGRQRTSEDFEAMRRQIEILSNDNERLSQVASMVAPPTYEDPSPVSLAPGVSQTVRGPQPSPLRAVQRPQSTMKNGLEI
ncbi:hypothetical protein C8J56DRAFT_1158437 [Mycena floridula]|nr:hypothetical protein C8J56DRAFT_1158437 [Mycena floridula]